MSGVLMGEAGVPIAQPKKRRKKEQLNVQRHFHSWLPKTKNMVCARIFVCLFAAPCTLHRLTRLVLPFLAWFCIFVVYMHSLCGRAPL